MGMKGGSEGGWSTTPAYCDRWMDGSMDGCETLRGGMGGGLIRVGL